MRKISVFFSKVFLVLFLLLLSFSCRKKVYVGEVPEPPPELVVEEQMPKFPWPPPEASAFHKIPNSLLVKQDTTSTFGDIANRIETALDGAGYTQISYYAVPDGFAMVTQLEQIDEDGNPKEPGRWSEKYEPISKFSLRNILKSLLTARKGLWRVTVFVVTSHDFKQQDVGITSDEAKKWFRAGWFRLSPSIARISYSDFHYCTALIYEFEQTKPNQEAECKSTSEITGKLHLERGGIWRRLGGI
ncbi:hypothetical protein ES705_44397 [subsurface metagenome]